MSAAVGVYKLEQRVVIYGLELVRGYVHFIHIVGRDTEASAQTLTEAEPLILAH